MADNADEKAAWVRAIRANVAVARAISDFHADIRARDATESKGLELRGWSNRTRVEGLGFEVRADKLLAEQC